MTTRAALIFDLDGTLVDSLNDIHAALNVALAALGLRPAALHETRGWVGEGATTLCRRAARGAGEDVVRAVLERFAAAYRDGLLDSSALYPGVGAALDALADRGAAMAVLSNKPDEFTQRIAARLAAPRWFRAVRGARSEADRKPSPLAALELARVLDRAPADIWIIGDSRIDIQTARAAGMRAAAVTWGFRDADELRRESPDRVIASPAEWLTLS